MYEKVSLSSLDNNLTKWSVTQYLFKAGLCRLALGTVVGTAVTHVPAANSVHAQLLSPPAKSTRSLVWPRLCPSCVLLLMDSGAERYKDLHAQFEGSREAKFLEDLSDAFEEKDVEKFTDAVYEFDLVRWCLFTTVGV